MEVLRGEEMRFGETLEKGMGLFNQVWDAMQFAKLESLLPMDGVGDPLQLTTADGVAFTVVSRNAGNGKQTWCARRFQAA